ncbi:MULTISPECIES: TetR/AcrR family transcriptional regulator [unclassified Clostridium]|uniref:TetR/AcrR family transcriptional regulator n=1 Tax=unclassified Clostridium TaxID=2614128 RepID=UPI000298301D|nr:MULTISPECIES: TetR/AcrR family transcriptional regulator [unclassified Clostridium]EKQ51490.1 MAG: transcriptional regulator [Clostridium sp. Maddingley MBC34-26]
MQILKDEIRNKILSIAENMFYQKGFKETTTRSIANEAGISVSNLYLYYENKEAIFYGVIDNFYEFFMNDFEKFFNHNDKNTEMNTTISNLIKRIIVTSHKKFVIITDKSQSTKYEGFKQQIITILNDHMKVQINKNLVQDELILSILSKNFIEGIIEIAKHYEDELWLEKSIRTLVKYHMEGMKHLM